MKPNIVPLLFIIVKPTIYFAFYYVYNYFLPYLDKPSMMTKKRQCWLLSQLI